jgi:hypothetical protein
MRETQRERRNSKRFRLRLAVVFSWRDEQGILRGGEGCSSNISGRGTYVRTQCAPPVGNSVEMNVFLPRPAYDIPAAEMHAKGQVTRVDRELRTKTCGFAAMNRTVLIRDSVEHVLDEKAGAEQRSKAAQQRAQAKQSTGLHRS